VSTPIPIDLLSELERCIRRAMEANPHGTALPELSEAALLEAVEKWRAANAEPPTGATSHIDRARAVLIALCRDVYEPFRQGLVAGRIMQPQLASGALRLTAVANAPEQQSNRALFLVEEYRLTSFLGRYGVGRTLSTFSLLPGEETTIQLKTWTTTSTSRTDTASVVDSEDTTVSDRFAANLASESSDTRSRQESSSWDVKAKASASWGVASVDASAEHSASTQTSRENFARTASEQVAENAREARSQRKTEVTASTTSVVTTGQEGVSERVVRNVNMRRTLNFVFRELNQEYITRLHLTGARFAEATPGEPGTWVEYPLSQLPDLLSACIKTEHHAEVARRLISSVATVNDADLHAVHPLELLTVHPDGSLTAEIVSGDAIATDHLPQPGGSRSLRWRPGPLAAHDTDHAQTTTDAFAVDGVLLNEQRIVMPTGAIVVDAALGEHDALDEYAMRAQEAEVGEDEVRIERERLLNAALADFIDPAERVRAYAAAMSTAAGEV
jgi:hypothetical protein